MNKNQIADFPKEIVEKMLYYQEQQGNKRDITVFEKNKTAGIREKGFTWSNTDEDSEFWCKVISEKKFYVFFEKYPKKYKTFP